MSESIKIKKPRRIETDPPDTSSLSSSTSNVNKKEYYWHIFVVAMLLLANFIFTGCFIGIGVYGSIHGNIFHDEQCFFVEEISCDQQSGLVKLAFNVLTGEFTEFTYQLNSVNCENLCCQGEYNLDQKYICELNNSYSQINDVRNNMSRRELFQVLWWTLGIMVVQPFVWAISIIYLWLNW